MEPLVEAQLQVGTRHPCVVVSPIAALLAAQGLETDATERIDDKTRTQDRVVDAKGAFLVSTEDESGTELIIEITKRQLSLVQLALHIEERHSPSFEILLESWKRMLKVFEAGTGINILALKSQVHIGIGTKVLMRTIGLLAGGYKHVGLYAARQGDPIICGVVLRKRWQCSHHCRKQ